MKVARTVWSGGKAGDSIKGLPITIMESQLEHYLQDSIQNIKDIEKQTHRCRQE